MVIMSEADGQGEMNNPIKTNGRVDDPMPCCSRTLPNNHDGSSELHRTLNGNSGQNGDCNNHHITNGAYPETVSTSHTVVRINENGGCSTTQQEQNEIRPDNNNKNLLKNDTECQQGNVGCLGVGKKFPNNLRKEVVLDSSSEDEECCIYTYKGDSNQMADLPSSFFRLDFMPSNPNGTSRTSSPDMDYLEMDFDPGPSNDRYSSSSSECSEGMRFIPEEPLCLPCELRGEEPDPSPPSPLSTPSPIRLEQPCYSDSPAIRSPPPSLQRQPSIPDVNCTVSQTSFCYCIANKLSPTSIDENFNDGGGGGTMVWKEQEAKDKQVNQIATSACGATAVINVLLGLNVPFTVSSVKMHVATRLRRETALIPDYLQSRCHAGATHVDMIRGLHNASNELVYARFFHMYPQRSISLTSWLSHWIRKGAVPIVTRNLQRGVQPGREVPDVWHHQMVYGVSARGIHLTNPLEVQSEAQLRPQLASPSVLMVQREDILSRWTPDTQLHPLAHPSLPLWRKLNVLGQVVKLIRERSYQLQHVTIPASYCSGITLAVLRSSPVYDELRFTPELPVDPFASN